MVFFLLAYLTVPEDDVAVGGAGGDDRPEWAVADAIDAVRVALERRDGLLAEEALLILRLPEHHRSVVAAADQLSLPVKVHPVDV